MSSEALMERAADVPELLEKHPVEVLEAHSPEMPLLDFELVRDALAQQVEAAQHHFKIKHRNLLRWAKKNGYNLDFLTPAVGKAVVASGLMASLIASVPQTMAGMPHGQQVSQDQQIEQQVHAAYEARRKYQLTVQATQQKRAQEQQEILARLQQVAGSRQAMDPAQASQLAEDVADLTGVPAVSTLDGYQLNTAAGRIGAEQHLRRYPGDSINEHFATPQQRLANESSGMAPGLGAYGYFAPSRGLLTPEAAQREEYYVVAQTFLSPNWAGNAHATYEWFRYRKVIIYSPATQKAVVGDIADAGPAPRTGKKFGGSPEVMSALQLHDGPGSPNVLVFFVNDPDNHIPLGPVDFKVVSEALGGAQ